MINAPQAKGQLRCKKKTQPTKMTIKKNKKTKTDLNTELTANKATTSNLGGYIIYLISSPFTVQPI